MHILIAVFMVLLAAWLILSPNDAAQLKTPAALKHDAPIVMDAAKKHLPSKEQMQTAVDDALPKIKNTADQIKSDLNKEGN